MLCRTFLVISVLFTAALLPGCQKARPLEVVRTSGDQYFAAGNYSAARDQYAELVSRSPGDWQGQYKLGLSLLQTGEYAAARRALEIAYSARRDNPDVANALAEAMFRLGEESKLFAFLRERASTRQTVDAYLQLGKYALELNDPDSAQTAIETAIQIDGGKTTEPYLAAATLAERLGHLDVAVSRLRQALGINPMDPRVQAGLRTLGEDPAHITPLPPGRAL